MTRGALAHAAGCNLETVRYYERIGLMPEPRRGLNGYRRYADEDLRRLRFIRRARALGFGVEDVRNLLSLSEDAPRTCGQVHALTLEHLAQVRRKIADLEALAKVLGATAILCEDGETPVCPVIEALLDYGLPQKTS